MPHLIKENSLQLLSMSNQDSSNNSRENRGSGRGLASSDETKERVASEGGKAPHEERGLQAADQETRERVAREGGQASHGGGRGGSNSDSGSDSGGSSNTGGSSNRGFASMSEEERKQISSKGGKSSGGGGGRNQ
jgi:hypothetical protein